jgi:hypothetical protein
MACKQVDRSSTRIRRSIDRCVLSSRNPSDTLRYNYLDNDDTALDSVMAKHRKNSTSLIQHTESDHDVKSPGKEQSTRGRSDERFEHDANKRRSQSLVGRTHRTCSHVRWTCDRSYFRMLVRVHLSVSAMNTHLSMRTKPIISTDCLHGRRRLSACIVLLIYHGHRRRHTNSNRRRKIPITVRTRCTSEHLLITRTTSICSCLVRLDIPNRTWHANDNYADHIYE